jgi:protease I
MDLTGKKIAIVSTDYFEEIELVDPLDQLSEMGAEVIVAAPHDGMIQALRGVDPGREISVDVTLDQLDPNEYDAVIIPGGVVNADHLRVDTLAREFVQSIADAGKTVAAICHGPWLLVSSGLVEGNTLTSYHTLEDDITNAGGVWTNQEVVVDGNLITSRTPDDLPAFIDAIAASLS